MKSKLEKTMKEMLKKAESASTGVEAMQFTQAALNCINGMHVIKGS